MPSSIITSDRFSQSAKASSVYTTLPGITTFLIYSLPANEFEMSFVPCGNVKLSSFVPENALAKFSTPAGILISSREKQQLKAYSIDLRLCGSVMFLRFSQP